MTEFEIIPLSHPQDVDRVRAFYDRADDYVVLEKGKAASDEDVQEFFFDAPPGFTTNVCQRFGMVDAQDRLIAIASLCFGYPYDDAAYIGLLLIDSTMRRRGLGKQFLHHIFDVVRQQDSKNLYLAVLDENRAGRAFWESQGFEVVLTTAPIQSGEKYHVRHRMRRVMGAAR